MLYFISLIQIQSLKAMKYYIIENYINAFTFEEGKEIGFFIINNFEYNGKDFEKESFIIKKHWLKLKNGK